jgi:dihydrofolate synthase/folylpolyglutamate synthase
MRRERSDGDQGLFSERLALRPRGAHRSLARARALAAHLGVDLEAGEAGLGTAPRPAPATPPALVVVGSKGKGTAATYASATLAAAGLRVGTLTSPGLRSNRERIRVDGTAIPVAAYLPLVERVTETLRRVAPELPDDGYLSPAGLFLLAALRHFADSGCEAVVLEAGMGGASDEVSLVPAGVVAMTQVLGEHLGVIGDSVAEIAADKAGVVGSSTRVVVSAAQVHPEAAAAIEAALAGRGCRLIRVADSDAWRAPAPLPSGLGRTNAMVGVAAGHALATLVGRPQPAADALGRTLGSVRLPGRLSHHRRGRQRWVVDCATNPTAISCALEHAARAMGPPTAVLTHIPRRREAAPLLATLEGHPVVRVRGLTVGRPRDAAGTVRLDELDLDSLGPRVLAVGPVYFAGEVLAILGVDCERSFSVSPRDARCRSRG